MADATIPRIEIDLNVRVGGNRTFAGFEDVDTSRVTRARLGKASAPVNVGDRVLVVESFDGICSDGTVVGIDHDKQLVYIDVDWHGFRDLPAEGDDS